MSKVKIVLNSAGVGELLKSEEMKNFLVEQAESIKNKCGAGYSSDLKMMGSRVIASVYTDSEEAYQDNLSENTLLKAVQG